MDHSTSSSKYLHLVEAIKHENRDIRYQANIEYWPLIETHGINNLTASLTSGLIALILRQGRQCLSVSWQQGCLLCFPPVFRCSIVACRDTCRESCHTIQLSHPWAYTAETTIQNRHVPYVQSSTILLARIKETAEVPTSRRMDERWMDKKVHTHVVV